MLGLALVALSASPPMPPGELPDLLAFPPCREIARMNRDAAQRHRDRVVAGMDDGARFTWDCRQEQVWYAWQFLYDALDDTAPVATRARNLANLRYRLGDAAYYAGLMPSPIPDYGPYPPVIAAPKN